jgi:ketosteroid isomerase-like protein
MSRREAEAELHAAMEDLTAAVRAKDLDRLMAHYAPDGRSFGLPGPLQYVGSDEVRKQAKTWLGSYQDPLGYEIRELTITAAQIWPSATASTGSTEP